MRSKAFKGLARASAWLKFAAAAAFTVALIPSTEAQTFPERTITLIVPFAPGGAADTTGRIMAEAMAKQLGQPVIVENATGAGGTIGTTKVKNAAASGYVIGLGHVGTLAASVASYANLPFDPRKDFQYLGLVSTTPNVVFVRKDFPASTLADFIA